MILTVGVPCQLSSRHFRPFRHLSTAYYLVEITWVRELKVPRKLAKTDSPIFGYNIRNFNMDRRFSRNYYYPRWNSQLLPVVLYACLSPANCHQASEKGAGKKTKSQKQKQRDQDRLDKFIERKSVCALFPFNTLENEHIISMIPRHTPNAISKKFKQDTNKINELQQEINSLKATVSTLQQSLSQEHIKFKSSETKISNLQEDILLEQNKRKEKQDMFHSLEQEIQNKLDREIENNERIRQDFSEKEKGYKKEIRNLKAQLSNSELQEVTSEQYTVKRNSVAASSNTSRKMKAKHKNEKSSKGGSQQNLSPVIISQHLQCHRCGNACLNLTEHLSECPAKDFKCENCSKIGHHTINCLHVCKGCGAKGRLFHKLEDCVAQSMNCAYCNAQGHLAHMCLERRYDELGY